MNQRDQIRSADHARTPGWAGNDGRGHYCSIITTYGICWNVRELALRRGVDWNRDSNSCNSNSKQIGIIVDQSKYSINAVRVSPIN